MKDTANAIAGLAKSSRRQALKGLGASALGLAAMNLSPSKALAQEPTTGRLHVDNNDETILNFALNLEYLEAQYYTYATTGQGIEAQGIPVTGRGKQGSVIIESNPQVPFSSSAIQQYALEIANDERLHVLYIRDVLGPLAIAQPEIDLMNSFTALAQAAGIIGPNDTFNPFADDVSFLLGAYIFEDVGVTAYRGAAPLINNSTVLSAAAGILGTEAYHASNIRTNIFIAGDPAVTDAQDISNLRETLDGRGNDDQGVVLNGTANIAPTNPFAMVFARTVRQVLNIVYGAKNANKGGFFPNGINL